MKYASYITDGDASFGLVEEDGIVDLGLRPGSAAASLKRAIEVGALGATGSAASGSRRLLKLANVRLLPVIPTPGKIICAGINYRSHAQETGRSIPEKPSMFARFVDTLIAHGESIRLPAVSTRLDFEGELAVIVGRPGYNIPRSQALDHVAGYTCFNDASIRDFQKYSVTAGKNFRATGPLGPWMVTADEVPDPAALTLVTRLNGVEMQRAGTGEMIHSVADLISFVSSFTPLAPGDVIATGTPEGVGHRRDPQLWMKPGDVVEVDISGIGILRNVVERES